MMSNRFWIVMASSAFESDLAPVVEIKIDVKKQGEVLPFLFAEFFVQSRSFLAVLSVHVK